MLCKIRIEIPTTMVFPQFLAIFLQRFGRKYTMAEHVTIYIFLYFRISNHRKYNKWRNG